MIMIGGDLAVRGVRVFESSVAPTDLVYRTAGEVPSQIRLRPLIGLGKATNEDQFVSRFARGKDLCRGAEHPGGARGERSADRAPLSSLWTGREDSYAVRINVGS